MKLARDVADEIVIGNHEAGICGLIGLEDYSKPAYDSTIRQRDLLRKEKIWKDSNEWMRDLKAFHLEEPAKTGPFLCIHGTPDDRDPLDFNYVFGPWEAREAARAALERHATTLTFVGHTHEAVVYQTSGVCTATIQRRVTDKGLKLKLEAGAQYVVNVGSVGYPRVVPYSTYAIYDGDTRDLEIRALPIDLQGLHDRMLAQGIPIPNWLNRSLGLI